MIFFGFHQLQPQVPLHRRRSWKKDGNKRREYSALALKELSKPTETRLLFMKSAGVFHGFQKGLPRQMRQSITSEGVAALWNWSYKAGTWIPGAAVGLWGAVGRSKIHKCCDLGFLFWIGTFTAAPSALDYLFVNIWVRLCLIGTGKSREIKH